MPDLVSPPRLSFALLIFFFCLRYFNLSLTLLERPSKARALETKRKAEAEAVEAIEAIEAEAKAAARATQEEGEGGGRLRLRRWSFGTAKAMLAMIVTRMWRGAREAESEGSVEKCGGGAWSGNRGLGVLLYFSCFFECGCVRFVIQGWSARYFVQSGGEMAMCCPFISLVRDTVAHGS